MAILTVTLHPSYDRVLVGDRLRPDDILRTRLVMEFAGGKGNNSARAIARMGLPVTAAGFQGGLSGKQAERQLTSEGIATDFVFCAAPTRISTLLHEETSGATYAIYEPGQPVTGDELEALLDKFTAQVSDHPMVLLCGSAQYENLKGVYARMIQIAAQHGCRVLLDSSGEALKLGMAAKPFAVKVNLRELGGVLAKPLSTRVEQVEALLGVCYGGVGFSALTLGADGLIATDGSEVWHASLKMGEVVNTVGCGDAVLAGMAYALNQGASLAQIAQWGAAFGAANTQAHGAGHLDPDLAARLHQQVEMHRLH